MPINYVGMSEEQVIAIKDKYEQDFMNRENVCGIGLGYMAGKKKGEYLHSIDIFLINDPTPEETAKLDYDLEGVPVQYKLTGGGFRAG